MKQADFLILLQDILQRDKSIVMEDILRDMDEWDSLSIMALIAYFDKYHGIILTFEHFKKITTVADLAALPETFAK